MSDYMAVGLFLLVALAFPFSALIPARLLQPRQITPEKRIPYECGVDTVGRNHVEFNIGYFMYAIVFLLFDIETIFLYPWAVRYKALGLFALGEMLVFVGLLVLGLWFAWKKGALTWR